MLACPPTRSTRRSSPSPRGTQQRSPRQALQQVRTSGPSGCTPHPRLLILLQQTATVLLTRSTDWRPTSSLPHVTYTGWPPPRRPTLDPKSSEDCSAPAERGADAIHATRNDRRARSSLQVGEVLSSAR